MRTFSCLLCCSLWVLLCVGLPIDGDAGTRQERFYTVLPGDTLESIALRFELDAEDILRRNRLSVFVLQPGLVLVLDTAVPVPQRARGFYRIQVGDSQESLAKKFKMTLEQMQWANPSAANAINLIPGQVLEIWREVSHERQGIDLDGSLFRSRFPQPMWFPPGEGYLVKNELTVWGHRPAVEALRGCLLAMNALFPDAPPVIVGDWSRKLGGRFPPHLSHKKGTDVDVGYATRDPLPENPRRFVLINRETMDIPRTWALLRALMRTRAVEYIFMDHRHQGVLWSYALDRGVSQEVLTEIFQYPRSRSVRRGVVRHERGHRDHMHIRFGFSRSFLSNQTWEALTLDEMQDEEGKDLL